MTYYEVDYLKFNQENIMKKWYQSKTVWFNIILGIVWLSALPEFISILPVAWLQYTTLAGVVGNYILRVYFTVKTIV